MSMSITNQVADFQLPKYILLRSNLYSMALELTEVTKTVLQSVGGNYEQNRATTAIHKHS